MKKTHTPAPWIVQIDEDNNDSSFTTIKIVDGSRESLTHPQGALTLANIQTFAPHLKEGIANANLIASAPDMLFALQEMMAVFQENEQYDEDSAEVISIARAAIAKAEGKA